MPLADSEVTGGCGSTAETLYSTATPWPLVHYCFFWSEIDFEDLNVYWIGEMLESVPMQTGQHF